MMLVESDHVILGKLVFDLHAGAGFFVHPLCPL
jgi:hypothetical protein